MNIWVYNISNLVGIGLIACGFGLIKLEYGLISAGVLILALNIQALRLSRGKK